MDTSAIASLDSNAFLTLFVTQLKNQDPTDPADTNEMISQLAQLTSVQKLDSMSTSFSKALETEKLTLAQNLIGREISFTSDGKMYTGVAEKAEIYEGEVGVTIGQAFIGLDSIFEVGKTSASQK